MPRYEMLPEHMQSSVEGYYEHGHSPGSFFRAVLENDLMNAAAQADDINLPILHIWAQFLYSELPRASWGDRETVDRWVKQGGAQGFNIAGTPNG